MKLTCGLAWVALAQAWVWDGGQRLRALGDEGIPKTGVRPQYDASRLPNIYAVAIRELQDLESEPLCHRTAARLLVNDCQVLDGKDEATVLTDSGRQVRDFVDFYAASLAICDLERGSFDIPAECAGFKEGSLVHLPASQKHRLHVSSKEIDSCLAGLAKSDSAWSTWVSYRHKALRFCEAARADNEKTQSIYLYQRITKVLENLTNSVDLEMERRMEAFDERVREAQARFRSLNPAIVNLGNELVRLKEILSSQLGRAAEDSAETLYRGLEDARSLVHMISVLRSSALEANAEIAFSHSKAMENVEERTRQGVEIIISALETSASSSSELEEHIKRSHQAVMHLETRLRTLEKDLDATVDLTEALAAKSDTLDQRLDEVTERTTIVLENLNEATIITERIKSSVGKIDGVSHWWLYIVCPALSLILGSYRLPPSGMRNIGLVVLGEGLGLVISGLSKLMRRHLHLLSYSSNVS